MRARRAAPPSRGALPPLRPPVRRLPTRSSSCARRRRDADREVVGLLASALAFGTVAQIKGSIATVLVALGPRPGRGGRRARPPGRGREARGLPPPLGRRPRRGLPAASWCGRCARPTARSRPSSPRACRAADADVGPALASFSARALALDHGGLYRGRSPADGRRRALLLSVPGGGQRLQAPQPLPALDGPPRRRRPRRLAAAGPVAARAPARRPHLRDRAPRAPDPLPLAGLGHGPRRHPPPPPARPRGPGEVRLRLPPHGPAEARREQAREVGRPSRSEAMPRPGPRTAAAQLPGPGAPDADRGRRRGPRRGGSTRRRARATTKLSSAGPQSVAPSERVSRSQSCTALSWQTRREEAAVGEEAERRWPAASAAASRPTCSRVREVEEPDRPVVARHRHVPPVGREHEQAHERLGPAQRGEQPRRGAGR